MFRLQIRQVEGIIHSSPDGDVLDGVHGWGISVGNSIAVLEVEDDFRHAVKKGEIKLEEYTGLVKLLRM